MRCAAAIPASALLAGTAAGVCLRAPSHLWVICLVVGWTALAAALFRARAPGSVRTQARAETRAEVRAVGLAALAAATLGFFGAGATLGAMDASRARRSSLLAELARADRDPTACADRVERAGTRQADCATVIEVEGRLREDAAPGEFGATFTLDVTHLRPLAPPGAPRDSSAARPLQPVEGAIRVTVAGAQARDVMATWRAGRTIRAPIAVRAPLPYRNFGLPDQRDRLALAGLTLFGSIKSTTLVQLIAPATWWRERAADCRAWIRNAITRHLDHALAAAVTIAVLIGDRATLPPEEAHRLQRAGTYHVIAISGGNVAILTGAVLMLLRLAPFPSRLRPAAAALVISAYALIVQEGESVRRATWAAVIYLIARAIDLETRSLNVLASVVALMLIASPLSIVSAAFWLTCGATLGILLHAAPLLQLAWGGASAKPPWPSRLGWALAGMVVTTLAAEVILLPITALVFSQITFAGLALNLIAIPLMTVVQLAGLATLACAALTEWTTLAPWAADLCATLARHAATLLLSSAHLVDLAPWLARRIAPPPMWLVAAYFACWSAIWLAPRLISSDALRARREQDRAETEDARAHRLFTRTRHARWCAIGAWCGCLLLIVLAPALPALPTLPAWLAAPTVASTTLAATAGAGRASANAAERCDPEPLPVDWHGRAWLRLTVLDVGQGAAALLDTSSHTSLLIDTGGAASPSFDIGARIVSPALWALGIRRLTAMAITHGDVDHAGGAPAILEDFAPRTIWSSALPSSSSAARGSPRHMPRDERLASLAALAHARGAAWRELSAGDEVPLPPARATIWHPASARLSAHSPGLSAASSSRVRNDDSLVLHVRLGDVSLILPGDISAAVERRLPPENDELAPFTLLLAPHHGSHSSSSAPFLDVLTPRLALVSAGLGNRHGHPAPLVLSRYRARGIELFRTDRDGAIQLLTDGRSLRLRTCAGHRWRALAGPVPRL